KQLELQKQQEAQQQAQQQTQPNKDKQAQLKAQQEAEKQKQLKAQQDAEKQKQLELQKQQQAEKDKQKEQTTNKTQETNQGADTYVALSSNPKGADVFINGVRKGSAPGKWKVASGSPLEITISKSGLSTVAKVVTLRPGETRSLGTIDLGGGSSSATPG